MIKCASFKSCSSQLFFSGRQQWKKVPKFSLDSLFVLKGFIKLCSVATPSSNPNKPKAKTMSLRRNPRPNPGYTSEPPPAYDLEMGDRNFGRGPNPRQ